MLERVRQGAHLIFCICLRERQIACAGCMLRPGCFLRLE
jgi:hypothetical protein